MAVCSLDPESSQRRGSRPDHVVSLGLDEIEPEDLEALAGVLNLSEAQVGAVYSLARKLKRDWLARFLDDEWVESFKVGNNGTGKDQSVGINALARATDQSVSALSALRRRLERLRRYNFLNPKAKGSSLSHVMECLENGTSVVLEFGRYGSDLSAYLLLANYLTAADP